MKISTVVFFKAPYKILRIMQHKVEHIYYRFFYPRARPKAEFIQKKYLIAGGGDFGDIARRYSELFPGKAQVKIAEADLTCEHIFDLLGSGPKKMSSSGKGYRPIDWHSDFKSGYRWDPKTFYRYIRYGQIEGADVIVPWELSRAQHLITLGEAFLLSGDMKYMAEFKNQINDWIDHNKVGSGVNWFTAMDSAIRAVNWLVATEFFMSDSDLLDEEFLNKLYGAIYQHGCYIKKNLQRINSITTNHYISGVAGLLFIALYCPLFRKSKKWKNFAIKELEKEIEKQVYPDGCDYEASASYHLLVLEIFFYAFLLCEKAGISLSDSYKAKLKKMFECSLYYIKPNGMAPQIGDNDNGRFLKFFNRPVLEHKYLLSSAAVYFKDCNFKLRRFDLDEESFWLFGMDAKAIWDNLPFREDSPGSRSFPDTGWYIMRYNDDYCFISCGPNGQGGRGGHAHNDKLSFELMLDGQDIVIDPGTYVYTPYPKERNKLRSTEYHNTVKFDGYEQNEISTKDIFRLPDRVKIKDRDLKEKDDEIIFQGEIQYLDFTHKRIIRYDKKDRNWQITDNIHCLKPVKAKLMFHLSPDVYYRNGYIFSRKLGEKIASIEIEGYKPEKGEYDYSPEYGIKMKAEYLFADISMNKQIKFIRTSITKVNIRR